MSYQIKIIWRDGHVSDVKHYIDRNYVIRYFEFRYQATDVAAELHRLGVALKNTLIRDYAVVPAKITHKID